MKRICLLVLVSLLVAAGCSAEGEWGILPFMEEQGKNPGKAVLLTDCVQSVNGAEMVDIRVEEALCWKDALYLAVTVKPKEPGTLVIPWVEDMTAQGGMEVMDHPAYPMGQSVQAYALTAGCDCVVTLRVEQSDERIYGLEYAAYDHDADGTLRMILQYGCVERLDAVELRFAAQQYSAETAQMTKAADMLLTCRLQ